MKLYLITALVGILIGIIYGLLNVRSPAPPVIALVGLLGILMGEQLVPLAKRLFSSEPVTAAREHGCGVARLSASGAPAHLNAKSRSAMTTPSPRAKASRSSVPLGATIAVTQPPEIRADVALCVTRYHSCPNAGS